MDWWAGDLKDKWHFLTQFSNGKTIFERKKNGQRQNIYWQSITLHSFMQR